MANTDCYREADQSTLDEILRQAEFCLDAQLRAAIACDRRAFAVAAFSGTGAVLFIGGGMTLLLEALETFSPLAAREWLGWICYGAAAILLCAVLLVARAERPIERRFAGTGLEDWIKYVDEKVPLNKFKAEIVRSYAEQISINRESIRRSSGLVMFATGLVVTTLVAALGSSVFTLLRFGSW